MSKEEYEVKTVATETAQVIMKGEEQVDINTLLTEIANDLAKIKQELLK